MLPRRSIPELDAVPLLEPLEVPPLLLAAFPLLLAVFAGPPLLLWYPP